MLWDCYLVNIIGFSICALPGLIMVLLELIRKEGRT